MTATVVALGMSSSTRPTSTTGSGSRPAWSAPRWPSAPPTGFQLEYGYGGLVIDPATHRPSRLDTANFWGHKRTDPGEPDV